MLHYCAIQPQGASPLSWYHKSLFTRNYLIKLYPAVHGAVTWRHRAGALRLLVNNGAIQDTILTPAQLQYPLELTAEKIWVKNDSKTNATSELIWWYYEVQTTDSNALYCNGITNVEASEGDIEDGSGAELYAGRCDCKWLIKVPEGKKIQFNFTEMDLEAKKDQVYIFNGLLRNAPILAIFSGQKIPPIVTSWGNMALVWFISSETHHGKGWKLHYTAID